MARLFNRNIEFSLLNLQSGQAFKWTDHKISFSINKDVNFENDNTGFASITNIGRGTIKSLASPVNPNVFLYTVRAGYDELVLVSEGHVTESNWRHEGGDITVDLNVSEATKYLQNPYKSLGVPTAARGTSIFNFIQSIISDSNKQEFQKATPDRPLKVRYLGNAQEIVNDLKRATLNSPVVITDAKRDLLDVLKSAGYRYFVENATIVITKERNLDSNLIRTDTSHIVEMNSKTGLLHVDLENVYDYQYDTKISRINLKSLFIPELRPGNIVRISDDEKYTHLFGDYIVTSAQINLENKGDGEFSTVVRATNLDYVDLTSEKSTFRHFRIGDQPISDRLKNIGGKVLSGSGN